jgi:hypothetical protein
LIEGNENSPSYKTRALIEMHMEVGFEQHKETSASATVERVSAAFGNAFGPLITSLINGWL